MTLNEETKPLKIYVGWDSREDIAYQVAKQSILDNASVPVDIVPLKQKELRKSGIYTRTVDKLASTEFTFTRFLIPELNGFDGWALFIDCDFVFLEDVKDLFDQADDRYAVMCAHHEYTPQNTEKMDGQKQTIYPRKNWSSMMLINCGHPANRKLTADLVNDETYGGAFFHRFSWLDDSYIGQVSHEWNWLVSWYSEPIDGSPKVLHYTEGGPWFDHYRDCEYNHEWYKYHASYLENKIENLNTVLESKNDLINKLKNKKVTVQDLDYSDEKKN